MKAKKGLWLILLAIGTQAQAERSDLRTGNNYFTFSVAPKPKKVVPARTYPGLINEEYERSLFFEVGFGVIKYTMPKSTEIIDVGLFTDTYSLASTSAAPMVQAEFGIAFKGVPLIFSTRSTTRARLGLLVTFAKKNNAVNGFYTNGTSGVPSFTTQQNIKRGTLMLMGSYDLIPKAFGLEAGFGVVGGALGDMKLYQIKTGYYVGQTLKANGPSFGGFVGATLTHVFDRMDSIRWEFGYRAVLNKVSYSRIVVLDQWNPALSSTQAWASGFVNVGIPTSPNSLILPKTPKIRVCSNEFVFGIVAEF